VVGWRTDADQRNPKRLVGSRIVDLDLEPVPLSGSLIEEHRLQGWMDHHPDVLPIDAIGSSWGPLISLGREIETGVGPLDNLFVLDPRPTCGAVPCELQWHQLQRVFSSDGGAPTAARQLNVSIPGSSGDARR